MRLTCLLLALVCASLSVVAQSPKGEIAGIVRDATGAVVPNAEVVAVNQNTGEIRTAQTGADGQYTLPLMPVGIYRLTTGKPGFRTTERKDIELSGLANLRVDFRLEVGGVAESITVTTEVPQVDTRSAMQGMLVDDRRMRDLPLNGRNAVDLVTLIPGINVTQTSYRPDVGQQRIRLNGGRQAGVNFLLDGGSIQYFHRGQGLELPPPDALQEFRVVTVGTPAEYGRGAAVLSAVTRSGTNQFHGSAWEFLRNDDFDARSFFSNVVPKLRFNQFGFTAGGPVRRNKHFFFLSYQGLRIREDQVGSSGIPPSDAQRRGDFSAVSGSITDPLTRQPFPGNQIPQARFDTVATKVLADYVPAANRPNGQYIAQVSRPTGGNQWLGRWDGNLTDRHRLTFRYFIDKAAGVDQFAGSNFPGYSPFENGLRMQTAMLEHMYILTPSLLNSVRVSFTRFNYAEANTVHKTLVELGATDFVHAGGWPTMPRLMVIGYFTLTPGRDRQRLSNNFDLSENMTWTRGTHQVKFGASVQFDRFRYLDNNNTGGEFRFDGSVTRNALADLLIGRAQQLAQASPLDMDQRANVQGYFVQDTWRVMPRLTLNLGLRYEFYPAWKERYGVLASYVAGARSTRFPNAPQGLVFPGDQGFPYVDSYDNFAPRFGLAWDVFGAGKTALRASYGISYEPLTAEMGGGVLLPQPFGLTNTLNAPYALSAPYRGVVDPFPYQVDPGKAVFVQPIQIPKAYDPGVRPPYTQNYNLGIQQQVTRTLMVDIAYVGNVGRKMPGIREANPAVYRAGATTGNTNARRVLAPVYQSIGMLYADGNTSYNALQAQVAQKFGKGLTFTSSYTWAKAIDEYTGSSAYAQVSQQNPQNPWDRRADRARHDNNIAHRWVSSYLYELPFLRGAQWYARAFGGWELGGILTLQSGQPINIVSGRDNSLTGVNFDRPNVSGSPQLPSDRPRSQLLARFFNTAVFTANAPGQFGNAGRNIGDGPGLVTWDVSISKAFRVAESQRLHFRWDAFNLPNRPNFNAPNSTLTSPAFGRIQGSGSGRVMQLSLKYVL